jgi:hypothetical protein
MPLVKPIAGHDVKDGVGWGFPEQGGGKKKKSGKEEKNDM